MMKRARAEPKGRTLAFCLRSVPIRTTDTAGRSFPRRRHPFCVPFGSDLAESRKAYTFYRRSLTPGADAGSPKRAETATRPREQPKTEGEPIKAYFIYWHKKQGKNRARTAHGGRRRRAGLPDPSEKTHKSNKKSKTATLQDGGGGGGGYKMHNGCRKCKNISCTNNATSTSCARSAEKVQRTEGADTQPAEALQMFRQQKPKETHQEAQTATF